MTLDTAIKQIQLALFFANEKYNGVVFDEWFVVSMVGLDRTVLHYADPRYEHDHRTFTENIRPMANELVEHKHRTGNVDFAPDGIGPGFDAMITIAPVSMQFSTTLGEPPPTCRRVSAGRASKKI